MRGALPEGCIDNREKSESVVDRKFGEIYRALRDGKPENIPWLLRYGPEKKHWGRR